MRSLLLLGLLGASVPASARPTQESRPGIRRRAVDLNAYRITQSPEYVNRAVAKTNPKVHAFKSDSYVDAATAFVKSIVPNASFRVVSDHYVSSNGIAHVNFKQTAHGLDIDNADFNVNVAADGSIFSYGNSFFQGKVPDETPLAKRDASGASKALEKAVSVLDIPVTGSATVEATEQTDTFNLRGTSGAQKDPKARLMYFVKSNGELALTWRVETNVRTNWLLSYVDANTNEEIHGVVDWVQDAKMKVYPWGVSDPDSGEREVLTDPWDTEDSQFGWFSDGETSYTVTRGNNAVAQTNPDADGDWESDYRPESDDLDFEYDWSPSWSPPESYSNASVTQLFYTANTYHDVLYDLGFTEEAGNFEANNGDLGGVGGDFVILNAQDGSGENNAAFSTPPDGDNGQMYMFLWTYTTPERDCAFEADVIIHEYTHGLSNRLTGGPQNANCLQTTEAGGMGEGWGDFMGTAIRLKDDDTRDTNFALGSWVVGDEAGIRKYLYSTDLDVNPYTYTTANTYNEVHDIGEIWATMLYEVMWNLIDKHGLSTAQKPEFDSDGIPTDGKFLAMKLVIDGMALQPCNPNFVQARDAILDADTALTGGDNQCEIWTAFAKRGLGEDAVFSDPRTGTSRTGSDAIPDGVC
ncbi:extracellular elastinolytic metallo proteinase [Xylaria intraflava]|nr:extracellular elastinolytic metallo proteinase [Xylaria intraflava]